ncbi:TetR/AcrR family transcriptional regulator [Leekyejoonella antrihumi]|uniref:HTH tetR-type domain-containing protein n=1 Tax=Leekyejoonella antrihumi TaxID=1660198 RepID=A0A563DTB7_9MICO|nr:hypothetical protein [Leekyejoonella antrihumi]TWP33416.1 hypothetical protein FGL98_21285 [Leekyejoonella antrihumi]
MARSRPSGTRARQEHLLESAIQVVGRTGLRGLTHRALDRAADLPEGTCSVYYRTRLALLTALTEYVAAKLTADVAQMTQSLPDLNDDPGAVIDQTTALLLRWSQNPELLVTMGDLALEAVRTPSLRDDANTWRQQLVDVVAVLVERSCKPQPRLRAQAVVASLEGVALSALGYPEAGREEYLRSTISMVLTGLAEFHAESVG